MPDTAKIKSFQKRFDIIRTLGRGSLLSPDQSRNLTIKDIEQNAFFEYLGRTYFIVEKNMYEETSDDFKKKTGYFIHELTCMCLDTGETTYFEWEYDDELEIAITLDRFSFRDLTDDQGQGIDEDDLDQIADEKDAVIVNSETFWYEDDWASIFTRNGREEKVYVYEFENKGGSKFLTIEEWQGSGRDEYRIYTSESVPPDSISIINKGDGS